VTLSRESERSLSFVANQNMDCVNIVAANIKAPVSRRNASIPECGYQGICCRLQFIPTLGMQMDFNILRGN
jgi:hypothetical protein